MRRPLGVIIGIAAGLILVAGVGASAHSALHLAGTGMGAGNVLSDDASAPRVESPEPSETPENETEAPPTAKPSHTPETETPDSDNEQGDNDDQGEDNHTGTSTSGTGEHDGGSGGRDD